MGEGYWILVWDGFGIGLNLIAARLHEEINLNNNHRINWWPCKKDTTEEEIEQLHRLSEIYDNRYRIIR